VGQGFALRTLSLKAGGLPLELHLQPHLFWLFWNGVSWNICPGWPWTVILPIAVSQVARITGVNHWLLAGVKSCVFLLPNLCIKRVYRMYMYSLFFIYVFGTQGLVLARQVLYHLSHSTSSTHLFFFMRYWGLNSGHHTC
jgi:hypothetical protein